MPTGYNFGFEVCRVCLSPDEVTKLTSVFAGDGSIGRKFQEISGVDISLDCHEDVLICNQCSVVVIRTFELRQSIQDFNELYFEPKRQEENRKVKANDNGASQGHPNDLRTRSKKDYMNNITRSERHDNVKQDDAGSSKVRCEKRSRFDRNLRQAPEKFQCSICMNWFVSPKTLKGHQQRVHQGLKNFYCDSCPRSFFLKLEMRDHIQTTHLKYNLKFKCKFIGCTIICKTKHLLQQHTSRVHKIEKVACETCGKVFMNKTGLSNHKRKVHLKNLK